MSTSSNPKDPFGLLDMKKDDAELRRIKKDTSLKGKNKKIHDFYKKQNELIDELLSPIDQEEDEDEQAKNLLKVPSPVSFFCFAWSC
jgi:hypothetical protein